MSIASVASFIIHSTPIINIDSYKLEPVVIRNHPIMGDINYCALIVSLGFLAFSAQAQEDWMLGPFVKQDAVNPVLLPLNNTPFSCPVRQEVVYWEAKDVFNPTALVKDGKIHLLYRGEDEVGTFNGTSRVGLAVSTNGYDFERMPEPIFYPDNDEWTHLEWEGGCEDPRIVEDESGTYFMTYTAYDGELARLFVASSPNLFNWTKHGPVFKGADNDELYIDLWSKSGSVVTRLEGERFVATKINGKYWMYWGESSIFLASSDDLINWTPLVDNVNGGETEFNLTAVFSPRRGKFDSDIVEPGPQCFIRDDGILLIYNSRNRDPEDGGDPELPKGTYSAGQILLNATSPMEVLKRSDNYFFKPEKDYEIVGQVNNVVFLEGLVNYNGSWYLYYGTADSKIALAKVDETK